jgi:DNA-binding XRE family transcriptional regulator
MTDIDHVGSSEEVSLGAAMRELRVEKGMTIEELAEAAGLSTGLISKIERDLGIRPLTRSGRFPKLSVSLPHSSLPGKRELQVSSYHATTSVFTPTRAPTFPTLRLFHLYLTTLKFS